MKTKITKNKHVPVDEITLLAQVLKEKILLSEIWNIGIKKLFMYGFQGLWTQPLYQLALVDKKSPDFVLWRNIFSTT